MPILRYKTRAQIAWLALEALVAMATTLFVFLGGRGDSPLSENSVTEASPLQTPGFRQRLADRFYQEASALGWAQTDHMGTTKLSQTEPDDPAVPIVLSVARPGQSDQYSLLVYLELDECVVLLHQAPNGTSYKCHTFQLSRTDGPPSGRVHSISGESGPSIPEAEELVNLLRRCLQATPSAQMSA